MKLKLFLCFLCNILLNVQACERSIFSLSERTSTNHGSPISGPILQKRSHDNFISQCGLHYDYDNQRLIFVDRKTADLIFYAPSNGDINTCNIIELVLDNKELAFAIPLRNIEHSYIVAANNTIYVLKYYNGNKDCPFIISGIYNSIYECGYELTPIVKLPTKLNELISQGTVDTNGNLLVGTKPDDVTLTEFNANLYRIEFENNNNIQIVDSGYISTAGISFDKDNENLYVADIIANVVYHLKYDVQTGKTANKSVLFKMDDYIDKYAGRISGVAVDINNKLWLSFIQSRMIIQFDPNTKEIEEVVGVPVSATNSIAFGDKNMDTLYLGSININTIVNKAKEPQAGSLIAVVGLPAKGFIPNHIVY